MTKIHTRTKRKLFISSHLSGKKVKRKKRPKTFATQEAANKWAKEHKITKFSLKSVKKGKRFQVVE